MVCPSGVWKLESNSLVSNQTNMATKATIEFKRGDQTTHVLQLPVASYVPGALIAFTAKPSPDNDPFDLASVINKEFGEAALATPTNQFAAYYNLLYATYVMQFFPADMLKVTFPAGTSELDYVGEFKYTTPGQAPISFPADNNYIKVRIFADIKRSNN